MLLWKKILIFQCYRNYCVFIWDVHTRLLYRMKPLHNIFNYILLSCSSFESCPYYVMICAILFYFCRPDVELSSEGCICSLCFCWQYRNQYANCCFMILCDCLTDYMFKDDNKDHCSLCSISVHLFFSSFFKIKLAFWSQIVNHQNFIFINFHHFVAIFK